MPEIPDAETPLSTPQKAAVAALTADEVQAIDEALMSNTLERWRKVTMVVATTMNGAERWPNVPDVFYADRIRELVTSGLLESQGDLAHMRYSEVRRPIARCSLLAFCASAGIRRDAVFQRA